MRILPVLAGMFLLACSSDSTKSTDTASSPDTSTSADTASPVDTDSALDTVAPLDTAPGVDTTTPADTADHGDEGPTYGWGVRAAVYLDPSATPEAWYAALYPDGANLPEDTDFFLLPTPGDGAHTLVPEMGPFDGRVKLGRGSRLLGGQTNQLDERGRTKLDGPPSLSARALIHGARTVINSSALDGSFNDGHIMAYDFNELRGFDVQCGPDRGPNEEINACVDVAGTTRVDDVNVYGGYQAFSLHAGPTLSADLTVARSVGIGARNGLFVFVTDRTGEAFTPPDGGALRVDIANSTFFSAYDQGTAMFVWPPSADGRARVTTRNSTFAVSEAAFDSVLVMGGRDVFGQTVAQRNEVTWVSVDDTFAGRKATVFGAFGLFGAARDNNVTAELVAPRFEGIVDIESEGSFELLVGGGFAYCGEAHDSRASVHVTGADPVTAVCDNSAFIDPFDCNTTAPETTTGGVATFGAGWDEGTRAAWLLCRDVE